MMRIQDFNTFNAVREAGLAKLTPARPRVGVGMGTCGKGNGAESVYHAFAEGIDRQGRDVKLAAVGCFGFCAQEPLVNVRLPGRPLVSATYWAVSEAMPLMRCKKLSAIRSALRMLMTLPVTVDMMSPG